MSGILDTSVFVAREQDRPLGDLPSEGLVSVVTVAELRVGVLVAPDDELRAQRMRTLSAVEQIDAQPVDDAVGREFAEIVAAARREGRRLKILNALVAATARALEVPVYTQDSDFDGMAGVEVRRV